jgi:integrase
MNLDTDRPKLAPGKADQIFFDDEVAGFGLRLRAKGPSSWVFQYRNADGRTKRLRIGAADALTARQARKKAENIRAQVVLGNDPATEKRDEKQKATLTIGVLAKQFLAAKREQVARGELSPRTIAGLEHNIDTQWKPLHTKPAHRLTLEQIGDRFDEITKNSGPIAANRAIEDLRSMFGWAIKRGKLVANPAIAAERHKEKSRDRVLSGDELVAVWKATEDDPFGRIVRLLILTGQRSGEVAGMAECELQRDLRNWSLPASRTKNGLAHDIPLSDLALAQLPPATKERELLFGLKGDRPFSGWSRSRTRLDDQIAKARPDGKPLAHWTPHDLRRSCATGMAEIGIEPHIIEACLNHVSGHKSGVAGVYNKAQYAKPKREALKRWSEHVEALLSGKPSNIVDLPTAAR